MQSKAMSGSYHNCIAVCDEYVNIANFKAIASGYEEDEETEDEF